MVRRERCAVESVHIRSKARGVEGRFSISGVAWMTIALCRRSHRCGLEPQELPLCLSDACPGLAMVAPSFVCAKAGTETSLRHMGLDACLCFGIVGSSSGPLNPDCCGRPL